MIRHLGLYAEFFLIDNMDFSNVCSLLTVADLYHGNFLKEECVDFIVKYFTEISETEEYENLPASLKEEIQLIGSRKV